MVRSSPFRRVFAALLPALFIALGIGTSLLDRGGPDPQTRFESRHDPDACPTLHDHHICTQIGHDTSLAAPRPAAPAPPIVAPLNVWTVAPTRSTDDRRDGPPSRAPPRIGSTRP